MSNNIINIRSDNQGKIHIVSSAHCDEFRNYLTTSVKKKQETVKSNDIIIECQGKKYNLNYNVGIGNSKLIKSWSNKMNNSGFTIDLSDCKSEAVEAALTLLHTGTLKIADVKILDVYRVLVKLECHTQEEDFYNYINKCIIGKKDNTSISNENEKLKFNSTISNNSVVCNKLFQKLLDDVTNIQNDINFLVKEKKNVPICEKKTISDLPDINVNNGVLNTKLIVGKHVYDYKNLEEIRKLPEILKRKKNNIVLGKKNFSSKEINDLNKLPDITDYEDAKIVVGKKVYDICDIEDFNKIPNYFEKIKESHNKINDHTEDVRKYIRNDSSQRSTSVDSNTSRNSYGFKKMQIKPKEIKNVLIEKKNNRHGNFTKYVSQKNIVTPPGQGNYITTEINPSNNHFSIRDSTARENYQLPSNFNTSSIKLKNLPVPKNNKIIKQKKDEKKNLPFGLSNKKNSESNDIVFVPPIDFFKNHYNGPNYEH